MNFLFDTNAIGEAAKPEPDRSFVEWSRRQPDDRKFISVITLGEVWRGVHRLPDGAKRTAVAREYSRIVQQFRRRTIPIDRSVVERWAELANSLRSTGVVIGMADELIAATALAHDLTLVTRNARHLEPTGCRLLSPWATTD